MPGLTSIRTDNGKLEIVNQLLLPHTTEFIEIKTIDDAYDAIKSMKVRIWTLLESEQPMLTVSVSDSWRACYCVPRRTCHRRPPQPRARSESLTRMA